MRLQRRIRCGTLSLQRVKLASALGHPAAREIEDYSFAELLKSLLWEGDKAEFQARLGYPAPVWPSSPEARVRAAICLIRETIALDLVLYNDAKPLYLESLLEVESQLHRRAHQGKNSKRLSQQLDELEGLDQIEPTIRTLRAFLEAPRLTEAPGAYAWLATVPLWHREGGELLALVALQKELLPWLLNA